MPLDAAPDSPPSTSLCSTRHSHLSSSRAWCPQLWGSNRPISRVPRSRCWQRTRPFAPLPARLVPRVRGRRRWRPRHASASVAGQVAPRRRCSSRVASLLPSGSSRLPDSHLVAIAKSLGARRPTGPMKGSSGLIWAHEGLIGGSLGSSTAWHRSAPAQRIRGARHTGSRRRHPMPLLWRA